MSIRWSMLLSHHPPVDYDRTWKIGSVHICVRCLGVAAGTAVALAFWDGRFTPPIGVVLAAAVPAVLDFTLHELCLSTSCQTRRFLTGMIFGVFLAALSCAAFQGSLAHLVLYLGWFGLLQGTCAIVLKCTRRLEGLLLRYEEGVHIE